MKTKYKVRIKSKDNGRTFNGSIVIETRDGEDNIDAIMYAKIGLCNKYKKPYKFWDFISSEKVE